LKSIPGLNKLLKYGLWALDVNDVARENWLGQERFSKMG
jgi:hypothetical protein